MNQRNNTNVTPAIDQLQVKIALLKKGRSIRSWAAAHNLTHTTVIRAMTGHSSNGQQINLARKLLRELVNNQKG